MNIKRAILIGLLTLPLAGLASFARGGQAAGPGQGAGLRERISDLYLVRLTRALDLTEEQTAKIYPLVTQSEKRKADLQRKMGLDLRNLRAELAKNPPDDKALLGLAGRIREARRLIRQSDEEVDAALEGLLTPVQQARYLIFNVEFLRNVGENLGRARGGPGYLKRTP
jgi:Spy/CpxP family protein refolding chaperone